MFAIFYRKVGKSLTIMGGASVTREIMQRKNAMQFYEIASLCGNVPLLSTLLQFSTKKTLQEGLDWGQP